MLRANLFRSLCLVLVIASPTTALAEPKDIPNRPPPLTFDKHVDYIAWYNDFVRNGRDDKDNAYPIYLKLCPNENGKGGIRPPEGKAAEQFEKAISHIWTPEEYPELAAYLKECEPFFEIAKKAASRPHLWLLLPVDGTLFDAEFPLNASARFATKALLRQAWMKRPDQIRFMLEIFSTILCMANHAEQESILLGGLVAVAERDKIMDQVLAALDDDLFLDEKDLAQVYSLLITLDPCPIDWTRAFQTEWAMQLDALQSVCKHGAVDEKLWESFKRRVDGNTAQGKIQSNETFDPVDTRKLIDELNGDLIAAVNGDHDFTGFLRFDKVDKKWSFRLESHPLMSRVLTSVAKAYSFSILSESIRCGTLSTLAIHAHHAKHQEWPTSLKRIDKALGLKDVYWHQFDPFTTKPFIYKVRDGQPWLYSVGWNLKDDGGKHDPRFGKGIDADYVFWPRPKESTPSASVGKPSGE